MKHYLNQTIIIPQINQLTIQMCAGFHGVLLGETWANGVNLYFT